MNSNRSSFDPRVPQIIYDILAGLQLGAASITFPAANLLLGSDANGNTVEQKLSNDQIADQTITIAKIVGLSDLLGTSPNSPTYNITYTDENGNSVTKVLGTIGTVVSALNTLYNLYNKLNDYTTQFRNLYDLFVGADNTRYQALIDENVVQEGEITQLETEVQTITSEVATNTANIATNTTNIATNTSSIATQATQISGVQATQTVQSGQITTLMTTTAAAQTTATAAQTQNVVQDGLIASNAAATTAAAGVASGAASLGASNSAAIAALGAALVIAGIFSSVNSNGTTTTTDNSANFAAMIAAIQSSVNTLKTDDAANMTFLNAMVNAGYATFNNNSYTLTPGFLNVVSNVSSNTTSINSLRQYLLDAGFIVSSTTNNVTTYSEAANLGGIYSNIIRLINTDNVVPPALAKFGLISRNAINGTTSSLNFPNITVTTLTNSLVSAKVLLATTDSSNVTTYAYNTNFSAAGVPQLATTLTTLGFYTASTDTNGVTTYTPTANLFNLITQLNTNTTNLSVVNSTLKATGLFSSDFTATSPLPIIAGVQAPTAPTIQKFFSGSGTYTTPTGPVPLYIRVKVLGGGGGGGGSNSSTTPIGGNGTNGSSSSFSNLIAVGGTAGGGSNNGIGFGGSTSFTPTTNQTILINFPGGTGGEGNPNNVSGGGIYGGSGGGSFVGSYSPAMNYNNAGRSAAANTGNGGSGAGPGNFNANSISGSGGGAGGYIEAIIVNPSTTYSYVVGGGGAGGAAGNAGLPGGAGSSGFVIVEEYYPQMSVAQQQINATTTANQTANKAAALVFSNTGIATPTYDASGNPTNYTIATNALNLPSNIANSAGRSANGGSIYFPPYADNLLGFWYASSQYFIQTAGGNSNFTQNSLIINWQAAKKIRGIGSAFNGNSTPSTSNTPTYVLPANDANNKSGFGEVYTGTGGFILGGTYFNNYDDGVSYTTWILFRTNVSTEDLYNGAAGGFFPILSNDATYNTTGIQANNRGIYCLTGSNSNTIFYASKNGGVNPGTSNNLITMFRNNYYFVMLSYSPNFTENRNYTYTYPSTFTGAATPNVFTTIPYNSGYQATLYVNGVNGGTSVAAAPPTASSITGIGCFPNTNNVNTQQPAPINIVTFGMHYGAIQPGQASSMFNWVKGNYPGIGSAFGPVV